MVEGRRRAADIGMFHAVQESWCCWALRNLTAGTPASQGTANFDVWELDSAVQAADVLLWPDTLALTTRVNAGAPSAATLRRHVTVLQAQKHTKACMRSRLLRGVLSCLTLLPSWPASTRGVPGFQSRKLLPFCAACHSAAAAAHRNVFRRSSGYV